MEKTEKLKDGTSVLIKELKKEDLDRLVNFYRTLPVGDRKYLRVDVTNKEVVEKRLDLMKKGSVFRLVADHAGKIIAEGALELAEEDWRKHQGEMRVIVAKPFQRKGLGAIMMRELYFLAKKKKLSQVVVQMMRPQKAARKICHKLGFLEQHIIPDYVKDLDGKAQDMILMMADIKEFWKELDHFYQDDDWRRSR